MENEPGNFSDALRQSIAQAVSQRDGTPMPAAPQAPVTASAYQQEAPPMAPDAPLQGAPTQVHADLPADPPAAPTVDPRLEKIVAEAQRVRAEKAALKAERDSWTKDQAADLAELRQFRELKARAKEDPVGWAELGGYNQPDEYATSLLDKGAFTPERKRLMEQEQRIKDLEARYTKDQETQQQAQQQAHAKNLEQGIQTKLQQIAEQGGEQFDLVKRTGAYGLVIQKWKEHYERTEALGSPEQLPLEQAMEQAEAALLNYYAPVVESPKIRSKYGVTAPQSAPSAAPATRSSGSINLKNRGTTPPPAKMSQQEALEQAGKILFRQFGPR